MQYRAIAFDLDGTLLTPDGKILPENLAAIEKVKQRGIQIFIVTGRHHTAAIPYYKQLNINTPLICCNGTYSYDVTNNQVINGNPFTFSQVQKVLELAEKSDIHLLMYTRDAMTFTERNPHMDKFITWVESCPEDVRPRVEQLVNFYYPVANQEMIWKFVISHADPEVIKTAVAQLPDNEFSCEFSWFDRADISAHGNTKGRRLLEVLKQYQLSADETVAFGDNFNDLTMLQNVGLGIAMGNAEEGVKQQVKQVIGANHSPAIANTINTLFR